MWAYLLLLCVLGAYERPEEQTAWFALALVAIVFRIITGPSK